MCNITSFWYLVNAMSRPRKQRISGFFSVLIWLWVCFAKREMFCCEFRWVLSLLYPLRFADILQKNFLQFFSFVSLFIFPLFAVSSNKTNFASNLFRIPRKRKQTNKQTNKAKQKEANSVYFSSITLQITLQFSVYLCLFFFFFFFWTPSKEGKSLNFLSLLNDVIFSRAHSDLNHKIKVPITTTGRSLLVNAKKFRIT